MQRQIFLQLYQRVNIFQWKQHQITDFPFFLFFISGIYRQFNPESRLADHFSVILFRPACAPSPVLRFSFYCKLLQLSPGTFFQVACKTVASLTSGKILIPPIINHLFSISAENQQATSSVFLKDPDQCTCLIFTGRLLMNLFSAAEGSRKIPCSIHSSCIPLEFIAGTSCIFSI